MVVTKLITFGKSVMNDSLYRNSIYLMASTGVMSVLGFVFWIIVARFFDSNDVGLATAMISVMGIIVAISSLGLNIALVRFLPKSNLKNNKINTVFNIVTVVIIIISSLYLLLIEFLTPNLMFIKENIFLALSFIFFMVIAGLNHILESIFIAFRDTKYNLYRNLIYSIVKVILPLIFVFFGFLGAFVIYSSWMIGVLFGVIYCFFILITKYKYRPSFAIYDSILKNIRGYSFDNYIAGTLLLVVSLLMPIIVLNKLGAEQAAYYYIPMMLANLLYTIPYSSSNSLFAEGSYDEKELKKLIFKSIKIIGFLLLIACIVIFIFGKYILNIFGENYAIEGLDLLKLFAISSFFVAFNHISSTILRIKNKTKILILINTINGILLISLSLFFLSMGIVGLGYAFLINQLLIGVIYIIYYTYNRVFIFKK